MTPKVTVLMSVYNGERYLREAITSILQQTWSDFEFLIINDGSTDSSREIIASYLDPRIRLLDNPTNLGLTKSLNRGLQVARGELIARQDTDDISAPSRLEKQVACFRRQPDLILLGCQANRIDQYGKIIPCSLGLFPLVTLEIRWALMFDNPMIHASVMFPRKKILDQFGGYNENYTRSQDYELWSRVANHHIVNNLPDYLVGHRIHGQSLRSQDGTLNNFYSEKIILRNLGQFLEYDAIPTEWARLFQLLRLSDWAEEDAVDYAYLLELLNAVFARFCELNPNAKHTGYLRKHLALQLVRLARFAYVSNKEIMFQAFSQACKMDLATIWKASTRGHKY